MKGSARRAEALRELARLLESGLAGGRALATLAGEPEHAADVPPGVARGAGLVDGLQAAGLLQDREAAFVRAVEAVGRADAGLVQVAADLERRARIERRVRSGLVLPLAVLAVAAFAVPAPALARGDLAASGYLVAVAGVLLPAVALLWLGLRHGARVVDALCHGRIHLGRPPATAQRRRLFAGLGRMLESGVDAASALEALGAAEAPAYRQRLARAAQSARAGGALVDALAEQCLLGAGAERALLQSGEAAGRVAAALRHRADQLGERLEHRAAVATEWLPRAIYLFTVAYAAVGIA